MKHHEHIFFCIAEDPNIQMTYNSMLCIVDKTDTVHECQTASHAIAITVKDVAQGADRQSSE
jgi:hypothetical protein